MSGDVRFGRDEIGVLRRRMGRSSLFHVGDHGRLRVHPGEVEQQARHGDGDQSGGVQRQLPDPLAHDARRRGMTGYRLCSARCSDHRQP